MSVSDRTRQLAFESIVLQGLWILILMVAKKRPVDQASMFYSNMLAYLDEHGNQSPGAKSYRRERTLPPLNFMDL